MATSVKLRACENGKVMQSTLDIDQLYILSEGISSKQRVRYLLRRRATRRLGTFAENAKPPREQLVVLCTRHHTLIQTTNSITTQRFLLEEIKDNCKESAPSGDDHTIRHIDQRNNEYKTHSNTSGVFRISQRAGSNPPLLPLPPPLPSP